MTTLVVGASGATGRLLVEQLLEQGEQVRIIVRSVERLPVSLRQQDNLSITEANLLEMTDAELLEQVQGCSAVASCLGHNLSLQGMFGRPRRLVTDAVRRLCQAIEKNRQDTPIKFILMNSSGNQNVEAGEKISAAQAVVIWLLRYLLPPHADNEDAAAFLQSNYGKHQHQIEWTAVRPDGLINEEAVSEYNIYPAPLRSAIFDAGKVSRINVAHFMAQLVVKSDIWARWKSQMPVIYSVD